MNEIEFQRQTDLLRNDDSDAIYEPTLPTEGLGRLMSRGTRARKDRV